MVLALSGSWMTIFLFLEKCLKVLKSEVVKFSDGPRSLEKLLHENKVVSSNVAFFKDKLSLHKFCYFTSQNSNSKGSKNSEYSIKLGFTGKLRHLHNTLFSKSLNSQEEKLNITLSAF